MDGSTQCGNVKSSEELTITIKLNKYNNIIRETIGGDRSRCIIHIDGVIILYRYCISHLHNFRQS